MQKQAWSTVTASSIANCYQKADFAKYSLTSTENIHPEEVTDFQSTGITDLDFRNYVVIDDNLSTMGDLSDAELCAELSLNCFITSDSDAESDNEVKEIPTYANAKFGKRQEIFGS